MALFQTSILRKYQNLLDTAKVDEAWHVFKNHFHNPEIQNNIRESKEEQYQAGFLDDLFVKVLGYVKNPEPNFTITTEYKNVKDSKKADGAIIINEKVLAVIELKGTNTTDLARVETQAFGYKNNQPQCIYVITSNFEKLRFYIDNAIEHIEFNLFTLTKAEFELLYICLHFDQISNGIPKKMKDASVVQEEDVTKKLYKDYSEFKRVLFTNLLERNPEYDNLEVFKKTQKLLDRFLFLFFAEDRGLIPPNSIRQVIKDWNKLKELDAYVPLLDRFRQFFGYVNKGYRGENYEIYAYNGGLFAPDEFLDAIAIDDDLLYKYTVLLADYDFVSEVDVNILGHIFENSLNEIDEIKAEIAGETIDRKQTKRKKDGVFYTPKYITKYIVENTVGKLCQEKKEELNIDEEQYYLRGKGATANKEKTELFEKLKTYREWLLQLTICDPACGSGAFLNQALDFLITEHRYIDEVQAKLFGDSIILSDIESNILENNLFGVDLNEESVDIAKLSLWLRTARPHRKLNDLSNNLKCGNSLIDDPEIAGDKAFDWEKEFPHVFEKGGFDVVIGNPPYGVSFDDKTKIFLANFDSLVPDFEIYIYFISLYKKILKENGYLSYIFPNTFLSTLYGKKYRERIFNDVSVDEIIDLSEDNTFEDASVRTIIFSFRKKKSDYKTTINKIENKEVKLYQEITKTDLLNTIDNIFTVFSQTKLDKEIILKIKSNNCLEEYHLVSQGYIPYRRSDLIKLYGEEGNKIVDNRLWHSDNKKSHEWEKEILGKNVNRYQYIIEEDRYVKYGKFVASYVDINFFSKERILIREITAKRLICSYIDEIAINNPSLINVIDSNKKIDLKYSLTILNSSLMGWYHNKTSPKANKGLFPKILINDVRKLPIKDIPLSDQQPFIKKADLMLSLNKDLQSIVSKFLALLESELGLEQVSKKMEEWYLLTFGEFTAELKKQKIDLSLAQKSEWMDFFEAEKTKATTIKNQITQTDAQIDQMVYELYGLTEEEIKIVEGN